MRFLYPGRIRIWRCWFLWREENWETQRKTLGARQEPTKIWLIYDTGPELKLGGR